MNEKRLKQIAEKAELAMWDEVTRYFPEEATGDFPPDASLEISDAIETAIRRWVEYNVNRSYQPDGFSPAFAIEPEYVKALEGLGLVDTSWGNDTCPSWCLFLEGEDEDETLRVHIDALHRSDREDEELPRFSIHIPSDYSQDTSTDNFDEVLETIKGWLI